MPAGAVAVAATVAFALTAWPPRCPGTGAGGAPSPLPAVPPTTPPAPTAVCSGPSCDNVEPVTTVCRDDVVTACTGRDHGILVELRCSDRCRAAWGKTSGTDADDRIVVKNRKGRTETYRQKQGNDAHTKMVEAQRPGDATACAVLVHHGPVCATAPASPAPSPA